MSEYTEGDALTPIPVNLGAAVIAATNDIWMLLTLPTQVKQMEVVAATLANGATVASNATDYSTFTVFKNGNVTIGSLNPAVTNLTADVGIAFTMTTTPANRQLTAADTVSLSKVVGANNGTATTAQCILTLWVRKAASNLGAQT